MKHLSETSSLLLASALLVACGGEGGASVPAPLPYSQVKDASIDSPADSREAATDVSSEKQPQDASQEADAPQDALKPKRTILTRDPFGNYEHTANLLLDGDFEWLGGYVSQYPWITIAGISASFEPPPSLVGVQCHSGMKCAVLDLGAGTAGIGVRGQDPNLVASLWIHTPTTDCEMASVSLTSCFGNSDTQLIPAESTTADAEGWCHFQGTVLAPEGAPCVFVSNDGTDGIMILDDAVLETTSAEGSKPTSLRKPSAQHLAKVGALRKQLREFFKPKPPAWKQLQHLDPTTGTL